MDILLVDDNLLMQQVLERFLGSLGYNVLPATRADEAVEQARRSKPMLILMDIHLPDQYGPDALRMLRQVPHCQNVPAIAMSGMDEHEARNLLSKDFSTYIPKPIDLDALEIIVRDHVTLARARSVGSVS